VIYNSKKHVLVSVCNNVYSIYICGMSVRTVEGKCYYFNEGDEKNRRRAEKKDGLGKE
jgi:hypothetical protein